MKRDFNIIVKNIEDGDMFEQEGKPLTMKAACLTALLLPQDGDDKLTGVQKCDLVALAFRMNSEGLSEISSEDIVTLKQRIAKVPFNNHIVIFRVHQFLEGE